MFDKEQAFEELYIEPRDLRNSHVLVVILP